MNYIITPYEKDIPVSLDGGVHLSYDEIPECENCGEKLELYTNKTNLDTNEIEVLAECPNGCNPLLS